MLWFLLYPLYFNCPFEIDDLKYPLLKSILRVIKKLETVVDNKIRKSNIKLAITCFYKKIKTNINNTKLPNKTVSIVFDFEKLYNFVKSVF